MKGGDILFYFKGIDQDLMKKADSMTAKLKNVAKNIGTAFVAGTAVAGTALAGLIGKSVAMAGELEQQIGGTEAVFGEFADTIQSKSKEAFSKMGLSANDYMATINKMGALMQGSGISTEQSMDLSAQAMQRAADVASIMGIDIDSAMESIAGAAKGNFTMMDNLGVAMNATTIQAYALSKGIKKSYNEMTKAEQVQYAMQMFLEKSAYATDNYSKENETFAGSLQTLKAAFSNFLSGAGGIDDVITSLTSFGSILVESIVNMAPQITNGIIQLLNALIPQIPILLQNILPSLVTGAVQLVQGIVNMLPTLLKMLAEMLPTIIQALVDGLIVITQTLAEMLPELMPVIIDAILGIIPILIDNLPLFIEAGWQLIVGIMKGMINSVPTLLSRTKQIVVSIIEYLKKLPTMAVDIGKNLVKGIWNGISNVKQWVLDKIKGFGKSILNGIKGIFGIHSPSTEFAWVGKMNAEGLIEGMEDMEKDVQQTFDGMFDLSPQLYGTSSMNLSPNITVITNIDSDPLGQAVREIKTYSGGAKNDFNYGMGGA